MVLINLKGDSFWIESLIRPRTSQAASGAASVDITLEKPGQFLGGALALDVPTTVTSAEQILIAVALRHTNNDELLIGDEISAIRLRIANENITAEIIGVKVILFMRGRGS